MEAYAKIRKINCFVFLQCLLIIGSVWIAANVFFDCHSNAGKGKSADATAMATSLPIVQSTYTDYPYYSFKSDKKWKKQKESLISEKNNTVIEGNGTLSHYNVSLDCVLTGDGAIIGRYHNENGISLDVNGFIVGDTRELKIRLGHGSETSYLSLSPVSDDKSIEKNEYKYFGNWGKKKLPTEITFKIIR